MNAPSSKRPWQSRTIGANAFIVFASFIPGFEGYVAHHPQGYAAAIALVNVGLRLVSRRGITVRKKVA